VRPDAFNTAAPFAAVPAGTAAFFDDSAAASSVLPERSKKNQVRCRLGEDIPHFIILALDVHKLRFGSTTNTGAYSAPRSCPINGGRRWIVLPFENERERLCTIITEPPQLSFHTTSPTTCALKSM
jgi:hypothetical protein